MILITGATGFLGMSIVARLLEDDDGPDIVLPVRARTGAEADARRLELLSRLYDAPPESALRLWAVPADLGSRDLGLRPTRLAEVTTVVHCAASISFTLPLHEARCINVSGTRHLLELCHRLPRLQQLVHVSTAYVAGRSSGEFTEADHDVGQEFRNTYEQSKWEAEYLVGRSGLPATIVRPSIVVGESDSGWTPAFNVIYWPLQAFARGLLDSVPADPGGLVDLVPIDHVVDVIGHAMAAGAPGVLHAVAGAGAPTVSELNEAAASLLGRPAPALEPPGSDLDHPAAVFAPYFDVAVRFGDARTRAAGLTAPAGTELLPEILGYARAVRWGRRAVTRQAARQHLLAA